MTDNDDATPTDAHDEPNEAPQDARPEPTDEPVDYEAKYREALSESRKWEQRAKDNNKAKGELERQRRESLTEAEQALLVAKDEARAEALAEFGSRLVDAKFEAAAAGRTVNGRPLDVGALLEGVNRSYYLTSDGEVDVEKVTRFVDNVAPIAAPDATTVRRVPDLGQGRRTTSNNSTADEFASALEPFLR